MRIIADENIPFVRDAFLSFGEVVTLPGRKILRKDLDGADMLLVRSVTPVNKALLEDTGVRFVGTATAGVDHVDREWLERNGVTFAFAPGSNAESVAQYIVTALLTLEKKKKRLLNTMTLGIVGVGNIGSRVARYAEVLGMKTILCDPPLQRSTGDDRFRPLDELICHADIMTFHVPLIEHGTDTTRGLAGERLFAAMKEGAILINTSRGQVIDDTALLKYGKKLGGLVIDVWNGEPDINAGVHSLADIATPHIAGYSFDGKINGTEAIYRAACRMYHCTPEWSSAEIFRDLHTTVFPDDAEDVLENVVSQSYPIMADNELLRGMAMEKKELRGVYFDTLRKTYRRRLEFSHFSVTVQQNQQGKGEQLKKLGFKVC